MAVEVLDSYWFCMHMDPKPFGLVITKNEVGEKKMYIGFGHGQNEGDDAKMIMEEGHKISPEVLKYILSGFHGHTPIPRVEVAELSRLVEESLRKEEVIRENKGDNWDIVQTFLDLSNRVSNLSGAVGDKASPEEVIGEAALVMAACAKITILYKRGKNDKGQDSRVFESSNG